MTNFIRIQIVFAFFIVVGCQKSSVTNFSIEEDTKKVKAILKIIDNDVSDTSIYTDDVVHMAQGSRAITNKAELGRVLKAEASGGKTSYEA